MWSQKCVETFITKDKRFWGNEAPEYKYFAYLSITEHHQQKLGWKEKFACCNVQCARFVCMVEAGTFVQPRSSSFRRCEHAVSVALTPPSVTWGGAKKKKSSSRSSSAMHCIEYQYGTDMDRIHQPCKRFIIVLEQVTYLTACNALHDMHKWVQAKCSFWQHLKH